MPPARAVAVVGQEGANSSYQEILTTTFAGTERPDGRFSMLASNPTFAPSDGSGDVEIRRLILQVAAATGLTGSIAYASRYTVSQNPETALTTRAGDIITGIHVAGVPVDSRLQLQGHWVGRTVVRSCANE